MSLDTSLKDSFFFFFLESKVTGVKINALKSFKSK